MNAIDYLTLISMSAIWLLMAINVFLSIGGFIYYYRMANTNPHVALNEYPFVSVLVPAHNESAVIGRTLQALLRFDYPQDRYEIIIINDNSADDTAGQLQQMQKRHPNRRIMVINTDSIVGGKGKSNALNIGLQAASGSVIAVYDADNTPQPDALRILVEHLMADSTLGATIGKFRTRNRNRSLLTRFINIETMAYQCMNQAGRWFFFGLCTIPGTNFVIHRWLLEQLGGWNPNALADDTELSFRIYRAGYKIRQLPQAVTWEQEPARLDVWMRQRTRWAMGNMDVLKNNFKYLFDPSAGKMRLDLLYYSLVYLLMATALVLSDAIFILGLLGYLSLSLGGLSGTVWGLACALFVCNIMLTLALEKNEFSLQSALLVLMMLFTYSKLWIVVVIRSVCKILYNRLTNAELKWYKTERTAD